jgi:AcrR family transcriptional regulator
MIEEAADRGYAGATIARLVALAGVSKRAFHEQFATKEAYFLAAYDAIVGGTISRIGHAYGRAQGDWHARLRSAFKAFVDAVIENPKAARVALVEAHAGGEAAEARTRRTRLIFEQMVSAGFTEASDGAALPPLLVKGIVCGIERVTRELLLAGEVEKLADLADELLEWALSYRSTAVARLAGGACAYRETCAPCRPRARVENDRARILSCAGRIAAAKGYGNLTTAEIVRAAGVSRARFEELFDSIEQCFLKALDRLALEGLVCVATASRSTEDRLAAVHRGMAALMRHIAENPALAQVAFVEILAVGPAGIQHRERLLGHFVELFVSDLPNSPRPSRVVGEATVGAICGIVEDHVTCGAIPRLSEAVDHVTYLALAPLIGGSAAVQVILASEGQSRAR